jgi:hypothetical protein
MPTLHPRGILHGSHFTALANRGKKAFTDGIAEMLEALHRIAPRVPESVNGKEYWRNSTEL